MRYGYGYGPINIVRMQRQWQIGWYNDGPEYKIGPFHSTEEAESFMDRCLNIEKSQLGHPEWINFRLRFWPNSIIPDFWGTKVGNYVRLDQPYFQAREWNFKYGQPGQLYPEKNTSWYRYETNIMPGGEDIITPEEFLKILEANTLPWHAPC